MARVDPRTDPLWRTLAEGPTGSLFTSPPWLRAVCDTYGFAPEARVALDDHGRPVGGFVWVPVHDIRGGRLLSLPFSDRADPLVADAGAWAALPGAALDAGLPLALRCMDGSPALDDPRFRAAGEAAWHGTPLDAPVEELHRRINSQSRRNVAAAERGGVTVTASAGVEAVRAYHEMHVVLRKYKYRLLAQPLAFFERIWESFAPDDAVVTLTAEVDGRPVAAAMYLVWRDTLYYKFGASLAEYLHLRPNDALYWAAIRLGVERGLTMVDWGLSDLDQPGLVAYKRKWASTERRIVTLRGGAAPAPPTDTDRVLGDMTRLLTEDGVPDDVTARAGASLYRYFC